MAEETTSTAPAQGNTNADALNTTPTASTTASPTAPVEAPEVKKAPEAAQEVKTPPAAEKGFLDDDTSANQTKDENKTEAKADEGKKTDGDETSFELKDLKLPDGFKLDEVKDKETLDIIKSAKLPKESAQKLIERYANGVKEAVQAQAKSEQEYVNKYWHDELESLKNDKDIGGSNLETTKLNARKGLDATLSKLSPELQAKAKAAIYGNEQSNFNGLNKSHWFIGFLNEIGKSHFTEAKPILNNMSSGAKDDGLSTAAVMKDYKLGMNYIANSFKAKK